MRLSGTGIREFAAAVGLLCLAACVQIEPAGSGVGGSSGGSSSSGAGAVDRTRIRCTPEDEPSSPRCSLPEVANGAVVPVQPVNSLGTGFPVELQQIWAPAQLSRAGCQGLELGFGLVRVAGQVSSWEVRGTVWTVEPTGEEDGSLEWKTGESFALVAGLGESAAVHRPGFCAGGFDPDVSAVAVSLDRLTIGYVTSFGGSEATPVESRLTHYYLPLFD